MKGVEEIKLEQTKPSKNDKTNKSESINAHNGESKKKIMLKQKDDFDTQQRQDSNVNIKNQDSYKGSSKYTKYNDYEGGNYGNSNKAYSKNDKYSSKYSSNNGGSGFYYDEKSSTSNMYSKTNYKKTVEKSAYENYDNYYDNYQENYNEGYSETGSYNQGAYYNNYDNYKYTDSGKGYNKKKKGYY